MVIGHALIGHATICWSQATSTRKAGASQKPTSPGGIITGVVFDSLHARPLENAEVLAEGKAVTVTHTDGAGKFTTGILPAGKYRVAISHPSLDSLSMSLSSPEFFVIKDSVSYLELAVPSAEGFIKMRCSAASARKGPSALFGHVESSDSQEPIPNVEVTLSWISYEVSKVGGVVQTTHAERDTTRVNGAYRICGLPNDLRAKLEARVDGKLRSVSMIAIPDSGTTVAVNNFALPRAPVSERQTGLIRGHVELPSGQPARGSTVEIVGTDRATLTDDRGRFALDSLSTGLQTIRVRLLGFQQDSVRLDVGDSFIQGLVVRLRETIPVLNPVSVSATPVQQALARVGFSQRSQHSVGHFLTGEQIARKSDFQFTDLLRGIPGLTVGIDKYGEDVVTSGRAGGSLLNSTHGCVQYFVDGQPWGNAALESMGGRAQDSSASKMLARIAIETARQINASLRKSDILGIEVYQGGGAPTYFNQGGHNCATIVIWTTASLNR